MKGVKYEKEEKKEKLWKWNLKGDSYLGTFVTEHRKLLIALANKVID